MLEFIVLGIVPGTSTQVTFEWVIIASAILLAGIAARMMERPVRQKTAAAAAKLSLRTGRA